MGDASTAPAQVPVIDIEPFRVGSRSDKERVAAEVDQVCRTLGFLIVSGHGVPDDLIDSTYKAFKDFFDLPLELKTPARAQNGGSGYQPLESTVLARTMDEETPPDLNERYMIHPVDVGEEPYYRAPEAEEWFSPNRWPDQPAEFRAVCTEYYRAVERVAGTLLNVFAVALDLDERYFEDKIDKHVSRLNGISYPPQPKGVKPGQLRAGAHTDYGCMTILYKDQGAGGLQVLHPSGDWIDVEPVPNAFIVNIGDLLARWTNDAWVSTYHRVVNPPPQEAAESRRVSIPFFHLPNYDAVISPLPTCVSDEQPPKYDPVTAAEHIHMKLGKTYEHEPSGT